MQVGQARRVKIEEAPTGDGGRHHVAAGGFFGSGLGGPMVGVGNSHRVKNCSFCVTFVRRRINHASPLQAALDGRAHPLRLCRRCMAEHWSR